MQAWVDNGLMPNTRYTFQVAAFNDAGQSEKSAPFTIWTQPSFSSERLRNRLAPVRQIDSKGLDTVDLAA